MKPLLLISALIACACSAQESSPAYQWYPHAWGIRYILMTGIADGTRAYRPIAHQRNIDILQGKIDSLYLTADDLFPVHREFPTPKAATLGLQVIEFRPDGSVITPNLGSIPLTAKRSLLESLVLVPEGTDDKRYLPFYLAEWSYVPGSDNVSPAVCNGTDELRYLDSWNPEKSGSNFGCREWTAQLYNESRPYIDVTSYQRHWNYIGSFIGWSRFTDPPKPVIGQQIKTWLCLHECPAGEQPGVIPDIRAWAKKHGFPVPKRPARQPEFPNSSFPDAHLE